MTESFVRVLAACIGSSGILAAAFGAHGLEKIAAPGGVRLWAIAAALQLATAPVLLFASRALGEQRLFPLSPLLLSCGLFLFCGTLYAMALGAPKFLGAITPLGGLLLAFGWLSLAFVPR